MGNKEPLFSIITVTYNAAQTLERTILSVQSQSYPLKEHIIIDGASTDATMDIIQRHSDALTEVISEKDKGLYDAMNKGLSRAHGDFICFLNAGDKLHSDDTLMEMAKSLSGREDTDVIYGETQIVDDSGAFIRMRRHKAPERLTWKSFQKGMLVCHQAFFVSSRFKNVPYNLEYRFSSDFDWCVRILKESQNILNTKMILIDYLQEGLTTKNRTASLKERFRIMSKHYGLFKTICLHFWFVLRALSRP